MTRTPKAATTTAAATTSAAATTRPNRVFIALAAAWMIAAIVLGGVVNAESRPGPAPAQAVTGGVGG